MAMLQRERNGALFGVHGVTTLKKYLTTPALLETPGYDNKSQSGFLCAELVQTSLTRSVSARSYRSRLRVQVIRVLASLGREATVVRPAAQVSVRSLPEWRSQYFRMVMRRGRKTAKVAMARRLAIHLYWMWRQAGD